MNSMPVHFWALFFLEMESGRGRKELIELCLGWQRDLRDPWLRVGDRIGCVSIDLIPVKYSNFVPV